MFSSLFTFPSEFKMMLKERASGMYRLSAFYLARTASDVPMDMFIPTIFVIIIYWMAWLQPTAYGFFCNWLAVMLTQVCRNHCLAACRCDDGGVDTAYAHPDNRQLHKALACLSAPPS